MAKTVENKKRISFNTEEEVVQVLGFKAQPELNNLCSGTIKRVELIEKLSTDSKEDYEYHGMNVSSILIEFKQNVDGRDRIYKHIENPIVAVTNAGEPIEDDKLESLMMEQYKRLMHILSSYKAVANYNAKVVIPDIDFSLPAAERLASFKAFYEAFVNYFNKGTDGNPIFTGKKQIMKLIYAKKKDGSLNNKFEFPNFVGKGFIEPLVMNGTRLVTSLEVYANEAITYVKVNPSAGDDIAASKPRGNVNIDDV